MNSTGGPERACLIVGAAKFDAHLDDMSRSSPVSDKGEPNNLLNARNDFAPLRDFGSRITYACLLGAIDKSAMRDLRTIKNARNLFGHSELGLGFQNQEIKGMLRKLKTPDLITELSLEELAFPTPDSAPRARFVWTAVLLIGCLMRRTRILKKRRFKAAPEFIPQLWPRPILIRSRRTRSGHRQQNLSRRWVDQRQLEFPGYRGCVTIQLLVRREVGWSQISRGQGFGS